MVYMPKPNHSINTLAHVSTTRLSLSPKEAYSIIQTHVEVSIRWCNVLEYTLMQMCNWVSGYSEN